MSRNPSCRRVRHWLQEQHDREPAASVLDPAVQAHLESCADCRRFREFLSGFGRELADSLDALAGPAPRLDLAALLSGRGRAAGAAAGERGPRGSWRDLRRPAARWAVPAAAAAVLAIAVGALAPRLVSGLRVQRSIRAETYALVEELFSQPLAQGVEASLAGSSLMEGLGEGDGLQGLGEGEEPALPGFEPFSL